MAGLECMLSDVEKHRPRVIVGLGQGAIIAALACLPVILEKACRERAMSSITQKTYRRAWSGVTAIVVVDPLVLPSTDRVRAVDF